MNRKHRFVKMAASAILVGFAGMCAAEPATTAASTSTTTGWFSIELIKAMAWPATVLIVAIAFYEPISQFISALGGRITKLSLFKVELELISATPVAGVSPLDDIRAVTTAAAISDSSSQLFEQVQSGEPADYAEISIGGGEEWLTSRLFIAAVMMERMRNVQVFVFVQDVPPVKRRFVAVASVRQLRWALACRFPWLEAAHGLAVDSLFPRDYKIDPLPPGAAWSVDAGKMPSSAQTFVSDTGAVAPVQARQIVERFLTALQRPVPAPPATAAAGADATANADEWVSLNPWTRERSAWVSGDMLVSLLPEASFSAWSDEFLDAPRAQRTRAILRRAGAFVALLDTDRQFKRLVSRHTLLEELAASAGEESEHGTPQ